ncbi:hypothetical protein [Microbacterium sp. YY-01]|uniref:hypothetical protein n=1 Tax=Microbacterium sp. YY-01 TaxID=3421634 RepID=UPI003D17812B
MSERIDHVAEARRLQGGAREIILAANKSPGTLAPHMAAVIMLDDARLEAQLALVEQQRIANLIRAYNALYNSGDREGAVELWNGDIRDAIRATLNDDGGEEQ